MATKSPFACETWWWCAGSDCAHCVNWEAICVGPGEKMEFMWCSKCSLWVVYPIPYVELLGKPYSDN